MTAEQRELCLMLIKGGPHGLASISLDEFLQRFPAAVEDGMLSPRLLSGAVEARDPEALYCALLVGFNFRFSVRHLHTLRALLEEDWHFSHEDIVSELADWPNFATAEALFRIVHRIPSYLEGYWNRPLAVKAIWGIGAVPGRAATGLLLELMHSKYRIVRKSAKEQLIRRASRKSAACGSGAPGRLGGGQ